MNTRQKLFSLAGTALIAAMLAGAAASAVTAACSLGINAAAAYGCALGGALLCALISFSPKTGLPAAIIALIGAGAYIAVNLSGGSVSRLINAIGEVRAGAGTEALATSGGLIAGACAAVISIFIYILIADRGAFTTVLAVGLCLGTAVICSAASGDMVLVQLIPAALGACLAFAHTAEQRQSGGHIKAVIPALIAVIAAALVIPAPGATYAPLENAAEKVRELYEDYFSYTHERVAFTIAEQGYDYYGLHGDTPTHMLGGPADPSKEAVMQVTTENDLLLRGTAKSIYTGYSWEDDSAKSRNLYYDLTRRGQRNTVFGTKLLDNIDDVETGFRKVEADVKLLGGSSSTLFTPMRLTSLDMALKNAVYYNSVGELFLSRNVEKGDEYSFTAMEPISAAAITRLAANVDTKDDGYEDAVRDYTALPAGIDDGVYQVVEMLTEGAVTDAEKAQAILESLNANCAYRLEVDYPPQDRDFVSYFLLESREGYCSYFASAMAVLCRIEGIPARYVEGYRVYAEPDGVTNVTGEDAHAWTEVYIKGIGWVAYDPTPGHETTEEPHAGTEPTPTPTPTPTPSPEPEHDPDNEPTPEPSDEPTAEPSTEPSLQPSTEPSPEPTRESEENPEENRRSGAWLWIVPAAIIILLILALMVWLFRKRLEATDPIRLAAKQKNENRAVLIIYRSILTLLMQLGQAPLSGETPEAFAERVCRSGLSNPDFIEFARGVILTRYSRTPAGRELTSVGARAYLRFRQHMKRGERMRFDLHRALHGLGDFDAIP